MNASHILRRAALFASAAGLAGTALLAGGGTAYAAPGPGHDGNWEQVNGQWRHDGDHHGRHRGDFFEPRHPRQARHWDDDLERCNPSSCWRGFGGHWRGFGHHHGGGGGD
jgi:hypothetical protein